MACDRDRSVVVCRERRGKVRIIGGTSGRCGSILRSAEVQTRLLHRFPLTLPLLPFRSTWTQDLPWWQAPGTQRGDVMETMWTVSQNVRSALSKDGGVLLDTRAGRCHSLNIVGACIWAELEAAAAGASTETLVKQLLDKFTVPRERLAADV